MTNHKNHLTKTAEQYRADAAQHEEDARESFERCDTDGFLSQWASGISGQVARSNADIAEEGGELTFERTILERIDGSPVEARRVRTQFGLRWRVDSDDAWLPFEPKRESTLAKRGFREVTETVVAPAIARAWAPSSARGLSGATQVRVRIFRADMPEWKHDAEGWHPVLKAR